MSLGGREYSKPPDAIFSTRYCSTLTFRLTTSVSSDAPPLGSAVGLHCAEMPFKVAEYQGNMLEFSTGSTNKPSTYRQHVVSRAR